MSTSIVLNRCQQKLIRAIRNLGTLNIDEYSINFNIKYKSYSGTIQN